MSIIEYRYNLAWSLKPIVNRCRAMVDNAIAKTKKQIKQQSFNILQWLDKYKQIAIDSINGLPDNKQPKQPQQQHISTLIDYDKQAERESKAISKSYKGCCIYFDKRLKHKRQHRPGGMI